MSGAGPRENLWRPSIDVLFRSAAVEYTARVIGVRFSGELDDGVAGLQAIKGCGGLALVQDPSDAPNATLPNLALSDVDVDYRVPARDIAPLLGKLIKEHVTISRVPTDLRRDALSAQSAVLQDRSLTELSCPDCGGPLWQSADQSHFQCLVGHGYCLDSLGRGSDLQLEQTLWAAIRMFEQRARIARMMDDWERERGRAKRADIHAKSAKEAIEYAETLRNVQATLVHSTERLNQNRAESGGGSFRPPGKKEKRNPRSRREAADPAHLEDLLDCALADSFPASDPVSTLKAEESQEPTQARPGARRRTSRLPLSDHDYRDVACAPVYLRNRLQTVPKPCDLSH